MTKHTNPTPPAADANTEEFLAYYKYLFMREMEAVYYAEEMAEEERNKPVEDAQPRKTIWFDRACKRRAAAMRFLDKYMKLLDKFQKIQHSPTQQQAQVSKPSAERPTSQVAASHSSLSKDGGSPPPSLLLKQPLFEAKMQGSGYALGMAGSKGSSTNEAHALKKHPYSKNIPKRDLRL